MESDKHSSEYAAPEVNPDRDRGDQNRIAGGLLQVLGDYEYAMNGKGQDQPGSDNRQTDPKRPGDCPARFVMIVLRGPLGDETGDGSAQAQIEQAHVGNQRSDNDPDAIGEIPQMMHDKWGQEEAEHGGNGQRQPIRQHVLGDAAGSGHYRQT